MSKTIFIFTYILSLCFFASGNEPLKPNIIFLMADDHRADAMGCMGNTKIETPNMDKLAHQGVLFNNCYATSPLCMASRATTMMGMYEFKTGCNFGAGPVASEMWKKYAYPVLLKEAGYRIAFAGKWGYGVSKGIPSDVFDKWGGFAGSGQGFYETAKNESLISYAKKYPHVSRALGAFGKDFIKESAATGEPFCLSLSFKAPHKPHNDIDKEDQNRYEGLTFPSPANYGSEAADLIATQAKLGRQYVQRKEWDEEHCQDHLKAYYQLISGVDVAIGMVIEELEKQGLLENTIIIYTADNGYSCGSHGLQGKVLPYDNAASIPLIIVDPRQTKTQNKISSSVVANIDFAPTILELAGVSIPKEMDGESLIPIVQNTNNKVRNSLLLIQNWGAEGYDMTKGLAVVTDAWKYINWCYADENVAPAEELFNLKNDPDEMKNVISSPEYSQTVSKLQAEYDRYHQKWIDECVDNKNHPLGKIRYDRNIPWREKEFKTPASKGSTNKYSVNYLEVTGKPIPGLIENTETKKKTKKVKK